MTVTLYEGDCVEIVPTLPPQSVDAIITDIPYGTTACKWDTIIPFPDLWRIVKHVLKPRGAFVTTASQPFTSALVMSNPKWFQDEWIWNKKKGGNIYNLKKHPYKIHENILVFSEEFTYNPIMVSQKKRMSKTYGIGEAIGGGNYGDLREYTEKNPQSILDFSNALQVGKLHPTQKPVALYEYLIKTYTNEGDTVLDITMGSGTTGIACQNTGRNFIGIEKDAAIFNTAEKRINQV